MREEESKREKGLKIVLKRFVIVKTLKLQNLKKKQKGNPQKIINDLGGGILG